jgi:pimeloyl-ACP methyl ester carboxylesterase
MACNLDERTKLYAHMAQGSYARNPYQAIKQAAFTSGFRLYAPLSTPEHQVYVNVLGREVVISFRGSTTLYDWTVSDVAIAKGDERRSYRFLNSQRLLNQVRALFPQFTLHVTGHSLGGRIAQILAHDNKDVEAWAFNAGAGFGALVERSTSRHHDVHIEGDFI